MPWSCAKQQARTQGRPHRRRMRKEERWTDLIGSKSDQYGYCPHIGTTSAAAVLPGSTTSGNCGSSWLLRWDASGGNADFSYGFQSLLGNVVYRSLGINWNNWSTGGSGSFGDSGWMNNSYYNNTQTQYTAPGFVMGTMNGWVLLWWGGTCDIILPGDSTDVS